jgi:hypothetical protein
MDAVVHQLSCAAAGVAGLRYHDLRSMATTAPIAGVDVKTTLVRMGPFVAPRDPHSKRTRDAGPGAQRSPH